MSSQAPHPGDRSEAISAFRDAAIGSAAKVAAASALTVNAFAFLAGEAGLYEIKAGEIALRRSKREEVRSFARRMIEDHTDIAEKLGSFLGGMERPNSPPAKLDPLHQTLIDDLNGASDADFDHRYIAQQKAEHEVAVTLFRGYGERGSDEGLRNLSKLGLPVLEQHLEMARRLAGEA
jgi:putative membrane protein